jgi:hypothetical protein
LGREAALVAASLRPALGYKRICHNDTKFRSYHVDNWVYRRAIFLSFYSEVQLAE